MPSMPSQASHGLVQGSDSSLVKSENKEKLLAKVDEVFLGEHVTRVEVTPEEVALAEMIATHEDDLPQA
jgi:hypothetical protein